MRYLGFIILVLILSACKQAKEHQQELFGINELSELKQYIKTGKNQNCDTLNWKFFNDLNNLNLNVTPINHSCKNLEFIATDKEKKILIYYQGKKFYVYDLVKSLELNDVNYLIN
jgi:hypothetical protein